MNDANDKVIVTQLPISTLKDLKTYNPHLAAEINLELRRRRIIRVSSFTRTTFRQFGKYILNSGFEYRQTSRLKRYLRRIGLFVIRHSCEVIVCQ